MSVFSYIHLFPELPNKRTKHLRSVKQRRGKKKKSLKMKEKERDSGRSNLTVIRPQVM